MGSPAKVREVLEAHRRSGLPFRDAWPAALETLEPAERQEWHPTLHETADVWRTAYEGLPATRAQLALVAIDQDPEREEAIDLPDAWQRVCGRCGGAIPAEKQSNAAGRASNDGHSRPIRQLVKGSHRALEPKPCEPPEVVAPIG